jgi:hypothetical protein
MSRKKNKNPLSQEQQFHKSKSIEVKASMFDGFNAKVFSNNALTRSPQPLLNPAAVPQEQTMLVYLNLQTLTNGISPLMAQKHCAKLRELSIKDYNIELNFVGAQDPYGLFRISPPSDHATLYQWMTWMGAEAVTVEASDMSPLVQNKIMRVAMENNFSAIADSLTMLQPDELFDALESSALKVFTAQPTQITSPDSRLFGNSKRSNRCRRYSRPVSAILWRLGISATKPKPVRKRSISSRSKRISPTSTTPRTKPPIKS